MTVLQGKDRIATNFGNELVGLYYYVLPENQVSLNNGRDSKIFGYVPTIQNINYNPFVDVDDYVVVETKLDAQHWGSPTEDVPNVYRLISDLGKRKRLGSYDLQARWNELDDDYETRLLSYPFTYYLLTDYMNPPLLLKPQFIYGTDGKINVDVVIGLSQASKYNIYVNNYKGDIWGNVEGMVNNNPLLYPVGSSAYSSFLASSQATFNQSNSLALMENDKTLQQGNRQIALDNSRNLVNGAVGIGTGIGSLLTGNIGGLNSAISSGINTYFDFKEGQMKSQNLQENTDFREYQIERMMLARKDDLLNTPRAIKSVGNDATFNKFNGRRRLDLIEYSVNPTYHYRLSQFFKRYGYERNEYTTPNIRSRTYWNFVKTANCQIKSSKMSHDNMEEVKAVFNKGVTFWHIDNGAEIKDYSRQNMEVR